MSLLLTLIKHFRIFQVSLLLTSNMWMFVGFLPVLQRPANFRGRFRNPTMSNVELIFTMVNSCQHLTIVTNTSFLDILTYSRFPTYTFFIEKKQPLQLREFCATYFKETSQSLLYVIKDKLFYLIILKIFQHVL